MHYVCHRSENKHSTASAPLAYPWRHCLSCLYVGPVAWSWWSCWLFVASPGRNRRQWSIRCLYSQISFLLTVVFHSIKLPINSQPDIQKHKETERERKGEKKGGNALHCTYSEVRLREKEWTTLFFSAMLTGGTGCYFQIVCRPHHPSCQW